MLVVWGPCPLFHTTTTPCYAMHTVRPTLFLPSLLYTCRAAQVFPPPMPRFALKPPRNPPFSLHSIP